MKRVLSLILIIVVCCSLSAEMNAVVDISPYFTFDNVIQEM